MLLLRRQASLLLLLLLSQRSLVLLLRSLRLLLLAKNLLSLFGRVQINGCVFVTADSHQSTEVQTSRTGVLRPRCRSLRRDAKLLLVGSPRARPLAPEIDQNLLVDLVSGLVVTLDLGVVGESGCGFFQAVAPSDCTCMYGVRSTQGMGVGVGVGIPSPPPRGRALVSPPRAILLEENGWGCILFM